MYSIRSMKNLGVNTLKRSMFLNRTKLVTWKKEFPHMNRSWKQKIKSNLPKLTKVQKLKYESCLKGTINFIGKFTADLIQDNFSLLNKN